MARKSLDDILDGNDEPEVLDAVEPQPEPMEEQPRDESGKFAPKGVEPQQEAPVAEAVPPTADRLPQDEYKALREEREKRQRLETELQALMQKLQQANQQPPAPAPSIWEDDQAWQQHFGGQVVSQAVQQATYQSKLATSEIMARQAFNDFGEVWEPLNEWLQNNPTVAQQASSDAHPWGYAYRAYKNQQTMQELGATDMETLKARLRDEVKAEVMAEMQAQKPAVPNIPPSLSNQRSVGARSGPAWSGPTPLADLLA